MRKTRVFALLLVAALVAALFAVLGPQRPGAAVAAEPSPRSLEAAGWSVPTTTLHFGRSSDSSTTTSEPILPRSLPSSTTIVAALSSPPATAKKASSPTTTPARPTTTATTVQAGYRSDYESQFFGKINALRSANGLPGLTRNGSLDAEARSWAKSIAATGKLAHSNIGRLVPPWSAVAENLAAGGSVDSVFSLLAGSGGHLDNMLGDYTHAGVGVWVDSSGQIWTVHLFAR